MLNLRYRDGTPADRENFPDEWMPQEDGAEFQRGFRHGFATAMAVYALGSVIVIFAFRAVGVLP